GRHAMDGTWRDVNRLSELHFALDEFALLLDFEQQPSGPETDRLVLLVGTLQAEGVAVVDVYQLADVPVGLCPVQLVSPGFVYSCHVLWHVVSLSKIRLFPARNVRASGLRQFASH